MSNVKGQLILIIDALTLEEVSELQASIRLNPNPAGYPFTVKTWDGRKEYLARPLGKPETVRMAGRILEELVAQVQAAAPASGL